MAGITQPTLENLLGYMACPGASEQEALNIIGRLLGSLFSSETGKLSVPGEFKIPDFNSQEFEYADEGASDDDLITAIKFKKDAVLVATLSITYIGSTNNIETMSLILP